MFNLIYHREENRHLPTRAAIYFSSDIDIQPYMEYTGPDIATGAWTYVDNDSNKQTLIITSVYMDINNPQVWPQKFLSLIQRCHQDKVNFVALCDSNAHSTAWGERDTNPRGHKMDHLLMQYDILIHNQGVWPEAYTYYRENSKSIVDLTLSTDDIAQHVYNWEVTNRIGSSDHRLIQFDVKIQPKTPELYRNFKKGSWKKFRDELDKEEYTNENIYNIKKLEENANKFTQRITRALDVSHPLQPKPNKLKKLQWWNAETAESAKQVKQAHNKWRRHRTAQLHNKLKSARKRYRRCIQKTKRISWQNFVNGTASLSEAAKFNKMEIATFKTPSLPKKYLP